MQLSPGSTKLWQPSNQLRGSQDAAAHAFSTGLSTGRCLMPMKARCGAVAPCRGAATVRQLPTRGKWWEAAGCVELTERVQLQPHAKLVAIQTEACPAVRSTQPANALHALLYKIHTVSRWKRRCNCLDCHEFSSTPSHAALLLGTAWQHRTGPSWASNDAQLKDLSNTRALKHLAPLATDYWDVSHSFVEPRIVALREGFVY